MVEVWQAAVRQQFSELVDAAVEGRPEFVRRPDRREVLVLSREYFEQTKPSLKSVLLSFRFGAPRTRAARSRLWIRKSSAMSG